MATKGEVQIVVTPAKTKAELQAEAFTLAGELYQLVRKIDRSPHYQPARLIAGFMRGYGNAGRLEVERLDRLVRGEIQAQSSPKPPRLPREGGKRPALPLNPSPLPNPSQRPGAVAAAGRVKPITVSPDVVTTVTMQPGEVKVTMPETRPGQTTAVQPAKQPLPGAMTAAGLTENIKNIGRVVGLMNDLHNEREAAEHQPLNESELATLKTMTPRGAGIEYGKERLYATMVSLNLEPIEDRSKTQLAAALIEHLKTV